MPRRFALGHGHAGLPRRRLRGLQPSRRPRRVGCRRVAVGSRGRLRGRPLEALSSRIRWVMRVAVGGGASRRGRQGLAGSIPRCSVAASAVALALALAAPLPAYAAFPYAPGGNPHDPTTYKLAPGTLPNEITPGSEDAWKFAATPENSTQSIALTNGKSAELCGV